LAGLGIIQSVDSGRAHGCHCGRRPTEQTNSIVPDVTEQTLSDEALARKLQAEWTEQGCSLKNDLILRVGCDESPFLFRFLAGLGIIQSVDNKPIRLSPMSPSRLSPMKLLRASYRLSGLSREITLDTARRLRRISISFPLLGWTGHYSKC
jgi:hypothetical protein